MAIDCHRQPIHQMKASRTPSIGLNILQKRRNNIMRTHSGSFQSKQAGQRRFPVMGWWKPLFVLTFRVRGGSKGASLRVIHSKTMPFKLFILLDLAVEMPIWTYKMCDTIISNWLSDILNQPSTWTPCQKLPWGAQRGVVPSVRAFKTLDTPFWPCAQRYMSKDEDKSIGPGMNS